MSNCLTIASATAHWLHTDEEAQWDYFAARHRLGLVYHLTSWKRVLEQAFPHIRGRFLVLRDDQTGAIQAGLPVYTVKSWLLGNRLVSIPFASFCDPLISSGAESDLLLPCIQDALRETACRRLEVRTKEMARDLLTSSLAPASTQKHHFLVLDKDLETLFKNCSKSSICQKVTKASKAGITVIEANKSDSVTVCHRILSQTRRRLCLPPMPFAFFAAMRSYLSPQHMKLFLAIHKGKPVGCHLVLTTRDLWISEYSGDTDDAMHGVNQLLYWETIKRAHAAGAQIFSFGRTSIENEGLLAYKKRWGTIEEDLVDFTFSSRSEIKRETVKEKDPYYSAAYRAARFVIGKVPKPIFQGIGDFCYRHLG